MVDTYVDRYSTEEPSIFNLYPSSQKKFFLSDTIEDSKILSFSLMYQNSYASNLIGGSQKVFNSFRKAYFFNFIDRNVRILDKNEIIDFVNTLNNDDVLKFKQLLKFELNLLKDIISEEYITLSTFASIESNFYSLVLRVLCEENVLELSRKIDIIDDKIFDEFPSFSNEIPIIIQC